MRLAVTQAFSMRGMDPGETVAKIMDTSSIGLEKAGRDEDLPGNRLLTRTIPSIEVSVWGRTVRRRIGFSISVGLMVGVLAGCESLKPITQSASNPNTSNSGDEMQDLLVQMQQPNPKPVIIASQACQPSAEPKMPPAVTTKGAERLVASSTPPTPAKTTDKNDGAANKPNATVVSKPAPELHAASSEGTSTRSSTVPVQVASAPDESGIVATASTTELIVKGPPRKVRAHHSVMKGLLWVGLALMAVAGGIGGRLLLMNRPPQPVKFGKASKTSKAGKNDDIVLPPELEMREVKNPPRRPVFAEIE